MLTSKVAKRYAQGLLIFTQENENTDLIFEEMKSLVNIMKESKDLNSFFATPFIDSKKKIEISKEIFKSFSLVSQNFISLIIRQGRETEMKNIAQEFINKVEDLNGVLRVSLVTATSLSKKTVKEILDQSGLLSGNLTYELSTTINQEIIGGYILRVGDQQIDASVKNKLNKIRKDFQIQ